MWIKVRGFRGAERADLDANPIALVAGFNAMGKSSVCQAVAAAVTGQPIPFFRNSKPDKPALTKTAAKALVRGGMKKGGVAIGFPDSNVPSASVEWPSFTVEGTGELVSSPIAAGIVNPLEFEDVDRQRFFANLLKSEPSDDDWLKACTDAGITEGMAEGIWNEIQVQGWDVAHKQYKETGARRKGAWEQVSGTKFGKDKAREWQPLHWADHLKGATEEGLATNASHAANALETARANAALGNMVLEQFQQSADLEGKLAGELDTAQNRLNKARSDLEAARTVHRTALAAVAAMVGVACPHCGGLVSVKEGNPPQLRALEEKPTPAGAKQRADAVRDAKAEEDRLVKLVDELAQARAQLQGRYETVRGSGDKLAEAKKRHGSADAIVSAEALATATEQQLQAFKVKRQADGLADEIEANQKIVDLLAPEGLRRTKLSAALSRFNQQVIAPLCAAAAFKPITFDEDLVPLYDGRPYFLLSESEKYRVRAVLQVAVAQADSSCIVILDGADILDADGRNGLFGLLGGLQFCSLVGMTMSANEAVPDLAAAGLGNSYWISDGVATQRKAA